MRLYIVHAHPVVEESLRITLGQDPDVEIVGSQRGTDQVEERILLGLATVLLLDGSVEVSRLIQIIRRVSAIVKVVVLVEQDEPELLVRCVMAGAVGYLSGPRGLGEIAAALRRAHDGWAILTAEQVTTLMFRSRLLPRVLPVFGFIGAPLLLVGVVGVLFGWWGPVSVFSGIGALALSVWEFGMGLWLVVKGFNREAVARLEARR